MPSIDAVARAHGRAHARAVSGPVAKPGAARRAGPAVEPVDANAPPCERILRAAHDLFYRDGVRATGIDRVIAESGVAKVTFYRCFASKDALVLAFLDHRHLRWMAWFTDALQRHEAAGRRGIDTLLPSLAEWFEGDHFRGCAFINSVTELGGTLPAVREVAQRHKDEMTAAIAGLLPPSRRRTRDARAIAVAVDGAIIQAQFSAAAGPALEALGRIIKALARPRV